MLIVYVTNGAWRAAGTATRNAESERALTRLGVPRETIWFLGQEHDIANQKLRHHLQETYEAILARLSGGPEVSAIFTPAWEGGHPDHDAIALVALALARQLGIENNVRQFPMYNAYRCGWRPYRVLTPIREAGPVVNLRIPASRRAVHLAACWVYRSQLRTMIGLFPFILFHYLIRGTQQYQLLDETLVSHRPHSGELLYERREWLSWELFENDVREFKLKHLQPGPSH